MTAGTAPGSRHFSPAAILSKQHQANDNRQEQPRRSAIVEPNRKPLSDHYEPKEHRRAGEKANELFREIVRRAAKRG